MRKLRIPIDHGLRQPRARLLPLLIPVLGSLFVAPIVLRNNPEVCGRIAAKELAEPCRLRVHFLLLKCEAYLRASVGRDRPDRVAFSYKPADRSRIILANYL
jgi:hypothetical protein